MSRPVLVIGGGGHAKVVINALRNTGRQIVGVIDKDETLWNTFVAGAPVLGGNDRVADESPEETDLVVGVGFLGKANSRSVMFEKFKSDGYQFASVIDPSAVVASDVEIAEGAQIMAGCVIQPGACVGRNSIVNTRASIDHDCSIGAHVHIAPGAILCGNVRVGDNTLVGAGATILQSVSIGSKSIVAAGAVVIDDVPDNDCVRGVPASPMIKSGSDQPDRPS